MTTVQCPNLRDELLERVERDQEVRHALGDDSTTEQWDAMAAVDLERLIAQHAP